MSTTLDNSMDAAEAMDDLAEYGDKHADALRQTSRALRVIHPPRPAFCQYALADRLRREYIEQRIRAANPVQ